MVWPFSKAKTSTAFPQILVFKDGASFLEYQCKYGSTEIEPNQGIVALVLDAKSEHGTSVAVRVDSNGIQTVSLKVASDDGGFVVAAQTPDGSGDRLKPGDVVIWVPFEHIGDIVPDDVDPRMGWVGFVVAKVKPEIDMANPSFTIVCRYA